MNEIRCWWEPIRPVIGGRWIPYTAAQVAARRLGRLVCVVVGTGIGMLPPMPPIAGLPRVPEGVIPLPPAPYVPAWLPTWLGGALGDGYPAGANAVAMPEPGCMLVFALAVGLTIRLARFPAKKS